MLVRCLYASRAAAPVTPEFVDSILEASHRHNPPAGITGMLCLCPAEGIFIQVLEGGRAALSERMARIMADARHRDVQLLSWEEIQERKFGTWSMGRVDIARVNTALLLKYAEKATLDPFSAPARATMALLEEFVQGGAIIGR